MKRFGFIPLPPIMPKGSDLGHRLGDVHHLLRNGALYVIGIHVAAALYHTVKVKDRLLQRMI